MVNSYLPYPVVDWMVRVHTPAWLRLVPALVVDADLLASHRPIAGLLSVDRSVGIIRSIGDRPGGRREAACHLAVHVAAFRAANAAVDMTLRSVVDHPEWDPDWNSLARAIRAATQDAALSYIHNPAVAAANAACGQLTEPQLASAAYDVAWDVAWEHLAPTATRMEEAAAALLGGMSPLEPAR
ncbi:hypothetical protein [Frankia sp. Cj3]|uniref:hypothetical protein n=1 Tax=Frankia sp. Cj3 TaxID=2880976 RepID=UPI001EF50441|nr:hypothetical protein [Frankia sp. Cj3]